MKLTFPAGNDPSTWDTHFRTALQHYDWMRVLYTWNEVMDRDALTVISLAAIVGRHPRKLLKEIRTYSNKYPGRINLFICGTTQLPVIRLGYDMGSMSWRDNKAYYGEERPANWAPHAYDLTLFHISHYWPKLRTEEAKRCFSPYFEWLEETGYSGDADSTFLSTAEWNVLKNAAKVSEPPSYTWGGLGGK